MKLTGKAPKKSPKKSPAALPKLAIVDACAAYLCEQPPANGSSYCAEHKAPSAKEAATQQLLAAGLGKKRAKPGAAISAADQARFAEMVAPLMAGQVEKLAQAAAKKVRPDLFAKEPTGAKVAPKVAPKTQKPPKAAQATSSEARAIIAGLLARGWTLKSIADAIGSSPGRVWFWKEGKNCRRVEDLRALGGQKAIDAQAKPRSGSLSVTASVQSARMSRKMNDPRQLILQLTSIRDAISDLLAAK